MKLKYESPAVKEAFLEWYNKGANVRPEWNPDIEQLIDYFNKVIAHEIVVEVDYGED